MNKIIVINSFKKNKILTCIERRLDPLFERDNRGGLLFVAPLPASKLFNNDGDRAHIKA